MNVFHNQREADAYTLLHKEGVEVFLETLPALYGGGNDLLNRWSDNKLVRITHTPGLIVRTFKKYAGMVL